MCCCSHVRNDVLHKNLKVRPSLPEFKRLALRFYRGISSVPNPILHNLPPYDRSVYSSAKRPRSLLYRPDISLYCPDISLPLSKRRRRRLGTMKTPRLIEVDGYRLPPSFDPQTFRDVVRYKPRKGRVVVATFPKCGTTWTLQIVMLILRKGSPPANAEEYFSLLPFMEMTPVSLLENLREDGCIKTHLPFDRINFSDDVKYVYVARHPADCAVSFYHHMRHFPIYFFTDATFDDFFEIFITGKTDFGDYFDNLQSWYEQRNKSNVFFITFEALKADTPGMILKIAKFLGDEYYEDLKADDGKILKKVLKYSTVDFMKETVDKYWEDGFSKLPSEEVQKIIPTMKIYAELFVEATKAGHKPVGNFIRKGGVGDGKIILSENQKKRLESRIQEKCAHSDVMELWESA